MPKPVVIVVAVAQNGVMGRDNRLPWRLPSDLKHFKATTMGGAIIMGRKTFESMDSKPLPGRLNVIVSQSHVGEGSEEGTRWFDSPEKAIAFAQSQEIGGVYLIGGAHLFEEGLPLADKILLTRVLANVEGDTQFPALSPTEWKRSAIMPLEVGPKDEYPCRLEIWNRIKS